jgi:hypothetical protein
MKRGADRQITKDDGEDPEEEPTDVSILAAPQRPPCPLLEPWLVSLVCSLLIAIQSILQGTWKEASAEKMAARKIISVKRKGPGESSGAPAPAFNFGAPASAGTPSFNFGAPAPAATPAAAPEAAPAAVAAREEPAVNAFAALQDKSEWECPACSVRNKEKATKCASCETPKAGAEQEAAPTVTFGAAAGGGFSVAGIAGGGFSFGAPAGGAFNFGASSAKPLFGSGAAAGSGVSFGSVGASGVTFGGSAPTTFEVTTTFGNDNSDPTKEEFKDKKAEASGTDKDTTVHHIYTHFS